MPTTKTMIVVYSSVRLNEADANKLKHYAFNTSANVKPGDRLESPEYNTPMQVVKVLPKSHKYFNLATGELSNTYSSTNQREIRLFILDEKKQTNSIYGNKLK